jgi:hypothetical protein
VTEHLQRALHSALHRPSVAHIRGDGDRTAPQRLDFLGSGGDLRGGTADQQQVSALAGVAERNPVPNPAPGPGDDGDAIAQT